MLETTECIPINNNGREYTDCMEFSLLRFLHMLFFSEEQLQNNDFSTFVHNQLYTMINPELTNWIERFPNIYKNSSYYSHDENGMKEREEWAKFVSDKPYFEYYRIDHSELFTNIKNILIFSKELLGLDINIDDPEPENIRNITTLLSEYTGKTIKIRIGYKEKDTLNLSLDKIKGFIEKDQPDINTLDKPTYGVISKRTILNLSINEHIYNWNLYEVYFKNDRLLSNTFITGHSAIM